MKRFYAILLSVVLVLAFATVASADFSATGKITLQWQYDGSTYTTALVDDSNLKLTVSKAWGPASGELTLKFDADAPAATGFAIDAYEFAYTFSDAFKLVAAKKFEVKTPIFDSADSGAQVGAVALYGVYTFDGGKVQVGTDAIVDALDFAAAAEFTFDALTVGGVVDLDDPAAAAPYGDTQFGIYAKYALTDAISLTGDLASYGDVTNLAAKAEYAGDPFTAAGTIYYDVAGDAGLYDWTVEGSYAVAENLKLSAEYNKDETYELKAALTIEAGPVFSVAYNDAGAITAKVEASF